MDGYYEMSLAKRSRYYDAKSLRVLLPAEWFEHLGVMTVDRKALNLLMCRWRYNPIDYYPPEVTPFANERGHDEVARYILTDRVTRLPQHVAERSVA